MKTVLMNFWFRLTSMALVIWGIDKYITTYHDNTNSWMYGSIVDLFLHHTFIFILGGSFLVYLLNLVFKKVLNA